MQSIQQSRRDPLVTMVATAMLSALALALFLIFEFPLLAAAPYLKMDFSAYFEAYQLPEHSSFFTGNY